jgi:hypothetical protein
MDPKLQLMAMVFLTRHAPLSLENRSWFVEIGPPEADVWPNTRVTAPLLVNGVEVGRVDMMELQAASTGPT